MAATWEWTKDGRKVREVQPFRKFASIDEAFDRHAKLLATAHPYEDARRALPNAVEFAKAIGPRYATDPDYGDTLAKLITDNNLTIFDVPVAVPRPAVVPVIDAHVAKAAAAAALPKPNPVVFAGVAAAPVAAAPMFSHILDGWAATAVPIVLPVIVIVAVLAVWQHIRNHQAKVASE